MKVIKAIWNGFLALLYGLLILRSIVSWLILGVLGVLCLLSGIASSLSGIEFAPAATVTRIVRPTRTQSTIRPVTSTTRPRVITATPRDNPGCKQAEFMSLADVGKTMCVYGTVSGTGSDDVAHYINFRDAEFQLITYDVTSELLVKPGECLRVEGEVKRLGGHTVMLFNVNDTYQSCD